MSRIRTLRAIATTPLLVLVVITGLAAADFTTPNTFENGTVADADQVNQNFDAIALKLDELDASVAQLDSLDSRVAQLENLAVFGPQAKLRIVYGEVDAAGNRVSGEGFTSIRFAAQGITAIASAPWEAPPTTIVETIGGTQYNVVVAGNASGANVAVTDPATSNTLFVPFRFVQIGLRE